MIGSFAISKCVSSLKPTVREAAAVYIVEGGSSGELYAGVDMSSINPLNGVINWPSYSRTKTDASSWNK